ncbi:MAG: hypothetical protein WC969_12700 [Elusimicrobiota bacterium]
MAETPIGPRRDARAPWSDSLICVLLWAAVLFYAWNHRSFLSQAARLF